MNPRLPVPAYNAKPTGSTASCGTANVSTVMSQMEKLEPVRKNRQFRCRSNPADAATLHKWKSVWERELSARGITEGEDVRALGGVIEGAESSDFFEAAETIERVEIFGVTGRKLGRFQITAPQIFVAKCAGTTS